MCKYQDRGNVGMNFKGLFPHIAFAAVVYLILYAQRFIKHGVPSLLTFRQLRAVGPPVNIRLLVENKAGALQAGCIFGTDGF